VSRTLCQAIELITSAFPKSRDVIVRTGEVIAMNPAMTMHVAATVETPFAFMVPPSIVKALARLGEFAMKVSESRVSVTSTLGSLAFRPLTLPMQMPREAQVFERHLDVADATSLCAAAKVVDGFDLVAPANRGVSLVPRNGHWIAIGTNGKRFVARPIGTAGADQCGVTLPPDAARALATVGVSTIELSQTSARGRADGVSILSSLLLSGNTGNDLSLDKSYERFHRVLGAVEAEPRAALLEADAVRTLHDVLAVGKAAGIAAVQLTGSVDCVSVVGQSAAGDAKDVKLGVKLPATASAFKAAVALDQFADLLAIAVPVNKGVSLRVQPRWVAMRQDDEDDGVAVLSQILDHVEGEQS